MTENTNSFNVSQSARQQSPTSGQKRDYATAGLDAHCDDSSDQRRAVEEACKHADDDDCKDIVQFCADDQLATLLTETATRGLWQTVARLLKLIRERDITDASYAISRAVEEACERADDNGLKAVGYACGRHHRSTVFRVAVQQTKWQVVIGLSSCDHIDSDTKMWAVEEACKLATKTEVRRLVQEIVVDREHFKDLVRRLVKRQMENEALRKLLSRIPLSFDPEEWDTEKDNTEELSYLWDVAQYLYENQDLNEEMSRLNKMLHEIMDRSDTAAMNFVEATQVVSKVSRKQAKDLQFMKNRCFPNVSAEINDRDKDMYAHFFRWCYQRRGRTTSLCQLSRPLLAVCTVNSALRRLIHSSMWEETRRWYLQFLVEEKLWDIVKEVADHSVYDDQRAWALSQARLHKRWDVVVVLADHGLTENRRYRVYRQVAKYADRATVRLLFEQAVDMRRVCEELMAGNPCRERPPDKRDRDDIERRRLDGENVSKLEAWYRERSERVAKLTLEHNQRCAQLNRLEEQRARSRKDLESLLADTNINWYKVLSQLRQDDVNGEETEIMSQRIEMTLQRAVQCQAWSVVTQLVRLGVDASQRDRLFPETIRQDQWGVARTLLEHGVSVEVSRAALQNLMEEGQWLLVARVMELSLDDTERRRVMQAALDKREGSVVAHGISVMEGRVTEAERQAMYKKAIYDGTWQAVKRLVEEKDMRGETDRDHALVAAVNGHRWDVVEHCVLQGADIDGKYYYDYRTMLCEKVNWREWDSVEGLVCCGANPNQRNQEDFSAFHRIVDTTVSDYYQYDKPWDVVKTLVRFHGNLNHPAPDGKTPLYLLTNCKEEDTKCAAEILDCALWWGSDMHVAEEDNWGFWTVLHTVCQGGRWDTIQYVVARGVNPLQVTIFGDTALAMAARYQDGTELQHYLDKFGMEEGYTKWDEANRVCRQKLVAECIRLGVSTHQPPLTDSISQMPFADSSSDIERHPVYNSLQHTDLVVLHMLYESGACSHGELLKVLNKLDSSATVFDVFDKYFDVKYFDVDSTYTSFKRCVSYLKKVVSTPRRLQSACRLVISHHLGVNKPRTRQKKVKQLRLPDRWKNYVHFSDLTDPHLSEEDVVAQLDAWGCTVDDVLPPKFFTNHDEDP